MTDCIICGGPAPLLSTYRGINTGVALEAELFGGNTVLRCERCGHGFCATPPPEAELETYYRLLGQQAQPGSWRRAVRDLALYARDRLPGHEDPRALDQLRFPALEAWLTRTRTPLHTLEVGAGRAGFSRVLRQFSRGGLVTDVVEPKDDVAVLYRMSRIRRVSRTWENVPETATYDLIHGSHVLEHFTDPHAAIARLARLLRQGGAAILEVPNCEEPYWSHRHHPDPPHVQFFTPASLGLLLERHAFVSVDVRTCGRPLAAESELGYLPAGAAEYMSPAQLAALINQRMARQDRVTFADAPVTGVPHGHEFIRAFAEQPG